MSYATKFLILLAIPARVIEGLHLVKTMVSWLKNASMLALMNSGLKMLKKYRMVSVADLPVNR